jgi:hypothetical protein
MGEISPADRRGILFSSSWIHSAFDGDILAKAVRVLDFMCNGETESDESDDGDVKGDEDEGSSSQ